MGAAATLEKEVAYPVDSTKLSWPTAGLAWAVGALRTKQGSRGPFFAFLASVSSVSDVPCVTCQAGFDTMRKFLNLCVGGLHTLHGFAGRERLMGMRTGSRVSPLQLPPLCFRSLSSFVQHCGTN